MDLLNEMRGKLMLINLNKKVMKIIPTIILMALTFTLFGCANYEYSKTDIIKIDLTRPVDSLDSSYDYLYQLTTVDNSRDYLAHPDSVLLSNGDILTMYPAGHGKGEILTKVSKDSGISWSANSNATPSSWVYSNETPTVYRLNFVNGDEKLIMTSANPKWTSISGDGFNASISIDEGVSWSEFSKYYGKESTPHLSPIVAMSSLTRLKENGVFADKWMGLFHDHKFINYKTILTFNENGEMQWSEPTQYFSEYKKMENSSNMCEVEVIRSDNGLGDELCLLTRSNSKKINSLISFSEDEGETWSEPRQVPASLSGERHKAEYIDGRLFITFRSIERDKDRLSIYKNGLKKWYSEGWVAWVGTYEDLKEGRDGQYRLKLGHTYLDGQTEMSPNANADTGYCGLVVLEDKTIVVDTYGKFGEKIADGSYRTYIVSKRIKLSDIDTLINEGKVVNLY